MIKELQEDDEYGEVIKTLELWLYKSQIIHRLHGYFLFHFFLFNPLKTLSVYQQSIALTVDSPGWYFYFPSAQEVQNLPEKRSNFTEPMKGHRNILLAFFISLPRQSNSFPQDRKWLPQDRKLLPQDSKSFPQVSKSLPQDRKSLLHDTKSFPQVSKLLPQVSKSFPQARKSFPQDTKSFPQDTKLFPQVRKSLPQDRKSFPQESNSFPEVRKLW